MTKAVFASSDKLNFQIDLNTVYSWASRDNMMFNEIKFQLISYNPISTVSNDILKYTTPSGLSIENSPDVKDLGIIMSNSCQI